MITLRFLGLTCGHHLDCGQCIWWAPFPICAGSHWDVHSIGSLSSGHTDHCCVLFVFILRLFQSWMALFASSPQRAHHTFLDIKALWGWWGPGLFSGLSGVNGILPSHIWLGGWVLGRIHFSWASLRHEGTQSLSCYHFGMGPPGAALSWLHLRYTLFVLASCSHSTSSWERGTYTLKSV